MTLTDVRKRPAAALSPRRRGWPGWIAVAVWASGIAAAFAVGWYLRRAGLATEDRLPPLHARARGWPLTWQMLPGAAVAAAAVAALPVLAARLPWRALPPVAWAGAALWTVALAVSGGWGAPAAPLDAPTEYPAGLAQLRPDPLLWLQTFTERLGGYTTHVRGHPPMPMLVLWALEKAGFARHGMGGGVHHRGGHVGGGRDRGHGAVRCGGAGGAGGAAVPGAGADGGVGRHVDGRVLPGGGRVGHGAGRTGRTPGGDVGACLRRRGRGAAGVPAVSELRPAAAVRCAAGGAASRPSKGPGARGARRRPGGGAAAFTLLGFWWPDGVRATLDTYLVSRGSAQRSYAYFVVANLAVLGLLTGPAVAHALPRALATLWRDGRSRTLSPAGPVAALAGAALLGVLALDASGVTKGEVERIWLPFAAWAMVAAALHRSRPRAWLAAQAATALAVQALVLSPW
ncbi:hypothetical protein [Actinomadura madurae]|uniref:hypothetical protein n=1 Tax=Actinomadura madurae TaxID=1993 RepID=UPI0020D24E8C|nr:hypothetical protein [Actinomadura madurae]MCQ0011589.1 hypothetical protein [Actinomadura madurae]